MWPLAADELDAIEDLFGGIVEIVADDYFVSSFEEGECGEGAYVASAAVTCISLGSLFSWFPLLPSNQATANNHFHEIYCD